MFSCCGTPLPKIVKIVLKNLAKYLYNKNYWALRAIQVAIEKTRPPPEAAPSFLGTLLHDVAKIVSPPYKNYHDMHADGG